MFILTLSHYLPVTALKDKDPDNTASEGDGV